MYHPYGNNYIYDLGNSHADRKIIYDTDEGWADPLTWVVSTSIKDSAKGRDFINFNGQSIWFATSQCNPAHAEGGVLLGTDTNAYFGELIVYDKVLPDDMVKDIQTQLMYDWGQL